MSAPDWAVERAYRARVEAKVGRALHDAEYEAVRSSAEVEWMRAALDAVWPETTTEWGVRWPWAAFVEVNTNEDSARWRAATMHTMDGIIVTREMPNVQWREVDS